MAARIGEGEATSMTHTEADFERLSWHDCHIWGLDFRVGQPDEGDWTSDLVLDIDFIAEWLCGVTGGPVSCRTRDACVSRPSRFARMSA